MKLPNLRVGRSFLSLLDASFRLGERMVFERTCWTFHRQEHWAILGANSSGKSLLVDGLRGRLPLVQGEIRYHYRPIPGLSAEESIAHVAFEDRKLEARGTVVQSRWNSIEEEGAMRVRDFLSYDRVMEVNPFEITDQHQKARPRFERRMRRAIARLQVAAFMDRTLLSLSNGETQRVQLARTLAHPMRLLILDEPFTGLDAASRVHLHRVLERLMATPIRVIIVSTRLEDIPRPITHLLCVDQCRVVAAGPRAIVSSDPNVRALFSPKLRLPTSAPPGAVHFRLWSRPEAERDRGGPRPVNGRCSNPPTPDEVVRMRNVSVRYGQTTILRNLDWTVRAGESWALLGPNGSGKTTLLSLILGDNPQVYSNDVRVLGLPRGMGESVWQLKKHIGWVSPELHQHFDDSATCLEVVISGFHDSIGLFEAPASGQRAAARHWLARLLLAEFGRTPLGALSGGLQRMVFLARALVKRPRLLILDEPCQGLDASHRRLFVHTLDALLRADEVTAIYVTHRPEEIPQSIRRVLRLRAGEGQVGVR